MRSDMKILGRRDLMPFPKHLVEPHEKQARANHQQTLDRLNERGGLSPCELLAVLEDRPWSKMDQGEAVRRLTAILDRELAP